MKMVSYFFSDSLRILRSIKNAVKHNTALTSDVTKRKISDILASSSPADHHINNVQKRKSTNYENNKLKHSREFAFRCVHALKQYLVLPFKRFAYAIKPLSDLIHTANNRGLWRSCQAFGLGLGGLPRLEASSLSRASGGYKSSLTMGSNSLRESQFSTAGRDFFDFSIISVTVTPVMVIIQKFSENRQKKLVFLSFLLDKMFYDSYTIN